MPPESLWIARDVPGKDRPTKQFRRYDSWVEYEVALFGSGLKHLYEVIPDGFSTRVWFFADHDCKTADARGMQEDEFVREVCRVHYAHFGLGPEDLGVVLFASTTCREDKLSVHVKVNLETTLAGARLHAEAVREECGADDRIKPDMSVYSSRAQQIRALGCSKLGHRVAKRPARGSDDGNKCHHMVRVNPRHGMKTIERVCPDGPPPSKASRGVSCASAESVVRAALGSSLLAARGMLGDAFDAETCRLEDVRLCEDGETLTCYADGSERFGGTLVCPFAGRAHKSNRARIAVLANGGARPGKQGTGEVVYRCMDAECGEDGKRIVVPYDVSSRRAS